MPLSEHEQRQLEQIEQALYADYPRFANAVRATDPRVHYKRRVFEAALGVLVGLGLLVAGVVVNFIPVGVAGFIVMLACSMWAVTSYRHMTGVATDRGLQKEQRSAKPPKPAASKFTEPKPAKSKPARPRSARSKSARSKSAKPPTSGMMDRLEQRWRRRQEGDR